MLLHRICNGEDNRTLLQTVKDFFHSAGNLVGGTHAEAAFGRAPKFSTLMDPQSREWKSTSGACSNGISCSQ
ncbi:hypothetical protein COCNU_08G004490 [Cocos nucifera]|uniref:Uncharacterized protein n=1 Tax=Cocos nucifera TaxID=13894 RepID=A0A8K0IHE9_COCNU|nr:hypothetical protein COCNU_08G004490 [Cocos nucifera]